MAKLIHSNTHAYVKVKACGCKVGMVVDDRNDRDFTARVLAEYVRDGYAVERMLIEDARNMPQWCCLAHDPDSVICEDCEVPGTGLGGDPGYHGCGSSCQTCNGAGRVTRRIAAEKKWI